MSTSITTSDIGVNNNETVYNGTATSSFTEYKYARNQNYLRIQNKSNSNMHIKIETDGQSIIYQGQEKVFHVELLSFEIKGGGDFIAVSKNDVNLHDEVSALKAAITNLGGGTGADLTELTARVNVLENPVSISSFSINIPNAALEVGQELTNVVFGYGITNYQYATSAKIRDVTGSVDIETLSAASGTHTEAVSITKSAPTTHNYRLDVVAGGRTISSNNRGVEWRWAYYYGNSSNTSLNEAGIKALATKLLRSAPTGNYSIADATGYKYICIEKNLTQPSGFKDSATGFAVAMQAPVEITITNDQGVSQTLNIYRTTNSFSGAITIEAVA